MLQRPKALEGRSVASDTASFSHLHGGVVIGLHQIAQVAQAVSDDIEHRSGVVQRCILRQASRAQSRLPPDGSGIRRHVAADNLQECRFTGPIPADDAHTLAALYLQAGVIQEWKMSERDRRVIQRNQRQGHYAIASCDANSS